MNYRIKQKTKAFAIYSVVLIVVLKVNHILFWWYYKRVPNSYHKWTVLKSINLFRENYEHQEFVIKGKNEVISAAIKREQEMLSKICNLQLSAMGITQDEIDPINKMFGTDLKGKSTLARDN